ncbi:MAG: tetratricopeptide repeat protein [Planctomycetota bacterium]
MMKHQWTVGLVGAAVFGIPAIASQESGAFNSLESALAATQAALQELVGLEPKVAEGDREAMARLIQLTETPEEEPAEIDGHIVRLRGEIGRLQGALDQGPSANGSQLPVAPTQGLKPGSLGEAVPTKTNTASNNKPTRAGNGTALEQPGYSADEMHQGKLLVRTGRYDEAATLLRKQQTSPEARYWLARALSGTGEHVEARTLLQDLAAEGEETHRYARWAAQDLRMIELREKLQQQAAPAGKSTGKASDKSAPKAAPKAAPAKDSK